MNPSFLITSRLPATLDLAAEPQSVAGGAAIKIHILAHPAALPVSYPFVANHLTGLIETYDPDYILHIGMAGGREYYTLETLAHRDGYRIRDIDGRDGYRAGEERWKAEGLPGVLEVGWGLRDVERRWRAELGLDAAPEGVLYGGEGRARTVGGEEAKVRLSTDAGHFLCDFTIFESLSRRWLAARRDPRAGERVGKVAFLHVPGDTTGAGVARGIRVTEAAIRALVGSWENGARNDGVEVGAVREQEERRKALERERGRRMGLGLFG